MKNTFLILLFIVLNWQLQAQTPVILQIDTVEVDCNTPDTIFVPVRVQDFDAVGAFQFSILWDTAYLAFAKIDSIDPLFNTGGSMLGFNIMPVQINQGRFSVSWTSKFGGTSAPDGTRIFLIGFTRKGGPFAPVRFGVVPSPIEVANPQGFDMPWDTIHGGVRPLDSLPPYIGCPANVTVQAGGPTPVNNIAPDSLSDNCQIFNVGWMSAGATVDTMPADADAGGSVFNPGVSTVTYTATDIVFKTDTCSFTVTVEVVNGDPVVEIGDASVSCGKQVAVPVSVVNFDSIYSMAFSVSGLNVDLVFDSVGGFLPALMLSGSDFNLSQIGAGNLGFSWVTTDSLTGTSVNDGSVLFYIYLTVQGQPMTVSPLTFTGNPVAGVTLTSALLPPDTVQVTYLPGSVSVVDDVAPVITCPASVTVDAPSGMINANVSGLDPIALSDDCSGTPSLSFAQSGATTGSGSGGADGLYNAGLTTVAYTATDSSGNTSTCSFTVTVNADLPLVLSLDSISVNCGANQVRIDITVQNFIDLIGANFSVTWDPTVLSFDTVFNDYPGLNLTASDFLGFVTTQNGELQFLAGNPISGWPQIPNDSVFFSILFNVQGPTNGIPIAFAPPIDAVNTSFNSVPVITQNGFFSLGGVDTLPPVLTCPASVTVSAPNGSATALVNGLAPLQLSDDCSVPVLAYIQTGATTGSGTGPANGVYNTGVTTVTYTATDGTGQSSSCTFTVTVESTVLTVQLDSVFINCDSAIQQIAVHVTVENFFDIIGLQFSVQWDPAVLQFDTVFNDYPGLNLNPSDFLGFAGTPGGLLRFLAGNAVDGWPDIPNDSTLFTIVFDVLNPNALSGLIFVAPFDAVDTTFNSVPLATINGNFEIVDTTPPVFDLCPADIVVQTPAGECDAVINVPQAIASDACSGLADLTPAGADTLYPIGNTLVVFTAVDSSGNTSTCNVNVTVTETVAPVLINCPDDIEVILNADTCSAAVSWQPPQATDNCGVSNVVISSSNTPGGTFFAGSTVVTYTATDFSGNTGTCSFTVLVRDTVAPANIICPSNATEPANPALGCAQLVFFGGPFGMDNCDANLDVSSDQVSGDTFPAGVTVVTFTLTDDSGNTATCTFNVTVVDSLAPDVACPSDIFLPVDSVLGCSAIVNFNNATATDNCDPSPVVTSDVSSGDTLGTGIHVVTFTATDGFGNTATCNFAVIVSDPNPPTIVCPADVTVDADTGACAAAVIWNLPLVTDDCDTMPDVSSVYASGDTLPIGVTQITYTAQDNSSNVSDCSFSVTVYESEPPVFPNGCPDDIFINLSQGCDTVVTWQAPSVMDNCQIDTLIAQPPSGSVFKTGSTTVTYILVDNALNTTTCGFTVTVRDQEPPVLTICPPNLTVSLPNGICDTVLNWNLDDIASDSCKMDTVLSVPEPNTLFGPGNYNITVYALDVSGNEDTCQFNIAVISNQTPGFVNFPSDDTLALAGACDTVVSWSPPLLIGTCDTLTLTSNYAPGDTFSTGTTWVVYEGVDYNGSPIRDSFSITVLEPVPPVFQFCPEEPVVVTTAGAVILDPDGFLAGLTTLNCDSLMVDYNVPQATDNCSVPVVQQVAGPVSGSTLYPGAYTLSFSAVDVSGNVTTCEFILDVLPVEGIDPLADPNPGCPEDTILVFAPAISGAVYTWTGPNSQTYPNQPGIVVFNQPGIYTLQVEYDGCISQVDSILVEYVQEPAAKDDTDINVEPGVVSDTFNLLDNDIVSVGGVTVTVLSNVDGLIDLGNGNFVYEAGEAGEEINFLYEICSMVCPNLCDVATVTISTLETDCGKIPNIITPNGDDVNDYLVIPCLQTGEYPDNSIIIYNQWGDKVYEASPYVNTPLEAWRGTLDGEAGKDLPDGTYYYIFTPGSNQKVVKGFVEIYR